MVSRYTMSLNSARENDSVDSSSFLDWSVGFYAKFFEEDVFERPVAYGQAISTGKHYSYQIQANNKSGRQAFAVKTYDN